MTRICIFAVVFDMVVGVERICEYDFYLIRILAACISVSFKFLSKEVQIPRTR